MHRLASYGRGGDDTGPAIPLRDLRCKRSAPLCGHGTKSGIKENGKKRGFGPAFSLGDVGRADKIMGSNLVKDTKYSYKDAKENLCENCRKHMKNFIKNIKNILDNGGCFDYYM